MSRPLRLQGDVLGRGLAFPFRAGPHGGIAMAVGGDDVEEAIHIILSTCPGERAVRPEFGCDVHQFVFEGLSASTLGRVERAIRIALDRWEPRIVVDEIEFSDVEDGPDAGALFVAIGYRLRTSNTKHNLIYPYYLVTAER